MEDQENGKIEATETSLDVVVEEYEQRLKDLENKYQTRINEINENHVREIRTLMRTGTSPEAEKIQEEEEEKPLDQQILEDLRNKYKLK